MRVNDILEFCDKLNISVVFQGSDYGYYELLDNVDNELNIEVEYADAELNCILLGSGLDEKRVKCCEW